MSKEAGVRAARELRRGVPERMTAALAAGALILCPLLSMA